MRFLIVFTVTCLAFLPRSAAQCPPELGRYLTGFDALRADRFSFLDTRLDSVKIVGYGEDTHGSAEFTVLAGELLRYLVTKHAFTGIVLETGVGEGAYLDAYVQGVRHDRDYILNEINTTWRYRTEEFVALLEWMRTYNAEHAERPIHLYGSEMQIVAADVRIIQDYLSALGHHLELPTFEKHLWQRFSPEEQTDLFLAYRELRQYLYDHGRELTEATSAEAYDRILHHLEVVGQFVLTVNQPRERHKHELRDLYMAENLQYPFRAGRLDTRLLYWAHNAHVGDWVSNGMVDVAGHQLAKRLGRAYYRIATDFGNGEFVAMAQKGEVWSWQVVDFALDPTTFTGCLAVEGSEFSFLDLRAARRDPALDEMLRLPLSTMSGAGAQYYGKMTVREDVGRAFDGIIYLDRVHPINRLPRP